MCASVCLPVSHTLCLFVSVSVSVSPPARGLSLALSLWLCRAVGRSRALSLSLSLSLSLVMHTYAIYDGSLPPATMLMQGAAAEEEKVDREWVITQQGVAVHGSLVFVTDSKNNCVNVFNKGDGKPCRIFGAELLNGPLGVAINSKTREVRRNLSCSLSSHPHTAPHT